MARDIDAILYSFKPTPTSADLAIYMHRISSAEPVHPVHDAEPFPEPERPSPPSMPAFVPPPVAVHAPAPVSAAPVAAAPAVHAAAAPTVVEPWEQPVAAKKGSAMPLVAVIALLVIGGGAAAAWFMMKDKGAAPAPAAATTSVAANTAAVPATSTLAPLTTATTGTTVTAGTTATTGSIDPSLVDAEVQKRIAAERARLEALARQQQPAQTATTAPARPTPAQVAESRPAPQQEAPAPTETRPAPTPVTQTQEAAPQPVVPAPQPAQDRVREGDLVAAGTPGLVPPRITKRGSVPYPPVARVQKIGGQVLTNVLVSETGSVLDVRILRGINRPVGLNEAAQATMRRSSFAPATKDGVRVKAWVTVPVDFVP
jgi:TonB family protein